MKVDRHLVSLEALVLDPLKGIEGSDWHKAPRNKWSLAQTIDHLAIAVDLVASKFEQRVEEKNMSRRASPRQQLLRHLVLGVGKLPDSAGATDNTIPADCPDPEAAQAEFRFGVERLKRLVEEWPRERQERIFVAHPIFGDFNLPEWVRFLYVHCSYHRHKIDKRLSWLRRKKAS